MVVYIIVAFLSIYMYGSDLESNVLDNVKTHQGEWTALILAIVFLVVIGCHIPFIFFGGKDCFLNLFNEVTKRSISKALERKLTLLDER